PHSAVRRYGATGGVVNAIRTRSGQIPRLKGLASIAPALKRPLAIAEVGDRRFVAEAHFEPRLHDTIIQIEFARQVGILEQKPVWVLEVDGLRPFVVNHGRDLDALADKLGPLRLQLGLAAGLEGEVIDALGHAEGTVEAAVELDGNARHTARLHKGEQLPLAGIEEDVPNLTT